MRSQPVQRPVIKGLIDIENSNICKSPSQQPDTGPSYIEELMGILSSFGQSTFETIFERIASENHLEFTHRPSLAFPKRLASIPCLRWLCSDPSCP